MIGDIADDSCREFPTVPEQYDLQEECGRGVSATVRYGSLGMVCRAVAGPHIRMSVF